MKQLIENRYIGAKVGDNIGVVDRRGFIAPDGGGDQPTLFAPVITGGINLIEWANNPQNGGFDVTIVADINGVPATSPLNITPDMDGKILTITASATNFLSAVASVQIAYVDGRSSIFAGNRSINVNLSRTSNIASVVEYYYGGEVTEKNTIIYTLPLGNSTVTLSLYGVALQTKSASRNELYNSIIYFLEPEVSRLPLLNGTITIYNVTQNTSVVYEYQDNTVPTSSPKLSVTTGDIIIMIVNADIRSNV